MKKKLILLFLSAILFFFIIELLMIKGTLTFGFGLGDLFPFYIQGLWMVILLIGLIIIIKTNKKLNKTICIILLLIILFSIIYSVLGFTINRGSEYPWNGKILF
jgi:hypothetical protein